MSKQKVITYQDTRGGSVDICVPCETKLARSNNWPKNAFGEQYATVSHGLHIGTCEFCKGARS